MKVYLVQHFCGCVLIFYLALCGRGHVTFLFCGGPLPQSKVTTFLFGNTCHYWCFIAYSAVTFHRNKNNNTPYCFSKQPMEFNLLLKNYNNHPNL